MSTGQPSLNNAMLKDVSSVVTSFRLIPDDLDETLGAIFPTNVDGLEMSK